MASNRCILKKDDTCHQRYTGSERLLIHIVTRMMPAPPGICSPASATEKEKCTGILLLVKCEIFCSHNRLLQELDTLMCNQLFSAIQDALYTQTVINHCRVPFTEFKLITGTGCLRHPTQHILLFLYNETGHFRGECANRSEQFHLTGNNIMRRSPLYPAYGKHRRPSRVQ